MGTSYVVNCPCCPFACCGQDEMMENILPPNLLATLHDISGCPCTDLDTVTMNDAMMGSEQWDGSNTFCGGGMRQIDLTFKCVDNTYVLQYNVSDGEDPSCGGSGTVELLRGGELEPSCDPPSFWFEITDITGECCDSSGATTIRVHITEVP